MKNHFEQLLVMYFFIQSILRVCEDINLGRHIHPHLSNVYMRMLMVFTNCILSSFSINRQTIQLTKGLIVVTGIGGTMRKYQWTSSNAPTEGSLGMIKINATLSSWLFTRLSYTNCPYDTINANDLRGFIGSNSSVLALLSKLLLIFIFLGSKQQLIYPLS